MRQISRFSCFLILLGFVPNVVVKLVDTELLPVIQVVNRGLKLQNFCFAERTVFVLALLLNEQLLYVVVHGIQEERVA